VKQVGDDRGVVVDDPLLWPDGNAIRDALVEWSSSSQQGQGEGGGIAEIPLSDAQREGAYWQTSARYALLKKYGMLPAGNSCEPTRVHRTDGTRELVFSDDQAALIRKRWEEAVNAANSNGQDKDDSYDLLELLSTSKSNGRTLKWSTMNCPPGAQFKLHAHPNLELVYCARGMLHEVRMKGEPISRSYVSKSRDGNENVSGEVKGPDLSELRRPWYFSTLVQGEWLVNEVSSVHKSFTATKGDGCVLLVLWSGSHADVQAGEEPKEVDVQAAVDAMDAKLGRCAGCSKSKWETMEETFLPKSERRSAS